MAPTLAPSVSKPPTSPPQGPDCPAMPGNCNPGGCDGVCKNSEGTIGQSSCMGDEGDETCVKLDGNVGASSCWGEKACKRLKGEFIFPLKLNYIGCFKPKPFSHSFFTFCSICVH